MEHDFVPTRQAGLDRLHAFAPDAGARYAAQRNFDSPEGVSQLSPYLRHRLLTEPEVIAAVRDIHGEGDAEKFIQEVVWRSYFKGWLELRPSVWADYRQGLKAARDRIATEGGLRKGWEQACAGATGIDCFDHWAQQLTGSGWLHNHARMWFASIWIFTLRLPWELGADFFLRHLLDGDPASNTCSWRWAGGLHTRGKHYVARAENIRRYTGGRFDPKGQLNETPDPLDGPPLPETRTLPDTPAPDPGLRTGLLLVEDDLSPDLPARDFAATATLSGASHRSPLKVAPGVLDFTDAALADARDRVAPDATPLLDADALATWARENALEQIVMPYTPTGPARDLLEGSGLPIVPVLRDWDRAAWPHATAGFFKVKKQIPKLLSAV
ncbi:FAD-binding domain-containing protein [Palleronia pelagia]|uniref:Deoxyribodipyrimidine photo-lyase n=1 Tax=Palleronia pelagia TaxID=387096 RepID=A0A1H8K1Y0_9RHOB|nr:FAD-binding domain-containing protein [Palleronia pelagia]SEN86556.1 deoxyribodipyrimidine photo-lyase [Palleronia pelagia]